MKALLTILGLASCLVFAGCETYGGTGSSRNSLISVQYGVIQQVEKAQVDANAAQGAVLGGLLGLAVAAGTGGSRTQQVGGAAAGALVGGLVQNERAANSQAEKYTVRLTSGSTVAIVTVNNDLQTGDCVSVEQGQYANLRRVSPVMCGAMSSATPTYDKVHKEDVVEANQCEQAKQEVLQATTEQQVNLAYQKMRALCEA